MENSYLYQCPVFGDWHDPLACRRRLFLYSDDKINEWLAEASPASHELLLPVVRRVFGLPDIDKATGTGVSDQQAIDVLNAFLAWLEGKG